eukprot:s2140_g2.t1
MALISDTSRLSGHSAYKVFRHTAVAEEKFIEKRTQNVLPNRQQHERLDVTAFKKSEVYADFYQEGTLEDLDLFLTKQDVDPKIFHSLSKKIEFIETELKGKVTMYQDVPMVVEFHYENADAANSGFSSASSEIKRFQRSVPTARQLEASKARWQEKSFSDVASAVGEDEEEDDEAREFFGLGRVPARAMHSKRSHAALADMEGSSPRSRLARQRLAGNDESERGRPSEELEQEEEENHPEDDDAENKLGREESRDPPKEPKQAKVSKAQAKDIKAVAKARSVYDAKMAAFSGSQLWQTKHKQRTIDLCCQALDDQASKIMHCTDEEAKKLVSLLVQLSERVKTLHELFTRMRDGEWLHGSTCATWLDGDRDMLLSLSPALIADIIVCFAKDFLKALQKAGCLPQACRAPGDDPEACHCFIALMKWSPADNHTFTVGYYAETLKNSGASNISRAISGLQTQLCGMLWDTVFRMKNREVVSQQLHMLPVPSIDIASLPEDFNAAAVSSGSSSFVFTQMVLLEVEIVQTLLQDFEQEDL